jgi:hypothetical protein
MKIIIQTEVEILEMKKMKIVKADRAWNDDGDLQNAAANDTSETLMTLISGSMYIVWFLLYMRYITLNFIHHLKYLR